MEIIEVFKREESEKALILTTDRMHQIACSPLTRTTATELRSLAAKVEQLAGVA